MWASSPTQSQLNTVGDDAHIVPCFINSKTHFSNNNYLGVEKMKCKIADIDFSINNTYPELMRYCRRYLISDTDDCDISLLIAENDISAEEMTGIILDNILSLSH